MIKIDKNVPIPAIGKQDKYPFAEMQIGDSFFLPCDSKNEYKIRGQVLHHAKLRLKTTPDFAITTRKCDGGLRVWRVS
jgi:hypothetical protein